MKENIRQVNVCFMLIILFKKSAEIVYNSDRICKCQISWLFKLWLIVQVTFAGMDCRTAVHINISNKETFRRGWFCLTFFVWKEQFSRRCFVMKVWLVRYSLKKISRKAFWMYEMGYQFIGMNWNFQSCKKGEEKQLILCSTYVWGFLFLRLFVFMFGYFVGFFFFFFFLILLLRYIDKKNQVVDNFFQLSLSCIM